MKTSVLCLVVPFEIFIGQVAVGFSSMIKLVYDLQLAMGGCFLIETQPHFQNPVGNFHESKYLILPMTATCCRSSP